MAQGFPQLDERIVTPERHRRISELFLEVCDLSREARERVLEEACRDDPELRAEVEKLLSADGGSIQGDPLPLEEAARQEGTPEPDSAPDEAPRYPEIPGFRITGELGEGGMGVVWRAVQERTRRQVALKLLRPRAVGLERARARFEREVELVARLDHPNIARVYESGVSEGNLYFAMELVEGVELHRFAEARHLSRRRAVELVRDVCRAVQHAHQHGVIHRDIKPSNLLVTEDGTPHVVDFGLAKAPGDEAQAFTLSLDGQIVGTPAYMSPEQAAGRLDELDTRTDVYSLGVVLYQLVTGRLPHDAAGTPLTVMRRIIEEDIPPASQVCGDVDGELDALLLKALARDVDQRYASAGELADDIDNYLNGEPLMARAPTTLYLLRKRLRKHWVQGSFAALVLLAVVAGVAFYILSIKAEQARTLLAKNEAERWAYTYRIQLAARSLNDAEPSQAVKLLEDCPAEFRRWEWNRLRRLSDPSLAAFGPFHHSARDFAFSPDGKRLVVATGKDPPSDATAPEVLVFDVETREKVFHLEGHENSVYAVAVSPDGSRILSGGKDGKLRRFDAQSGKLLRSEEVGWIFDIAFSPDGRYLAWGTYPDGLTVRDNATGRVRFVPGPGGQDDRLSFSADGKRLLWLYQTWRDRNGHVHLFELPPVREISRLVEREILSASIRADGQQVVLGRDRGFELWNPATGERSFVTCGRNRIAARYGPEGRTIYSFDHSDTIGVWDPRSEMSPHPGSSARPSEEAYSLRMRLLDCDADVWYSQLSPDGTIAVSGKDRVKLWDTTRDPQSEVLADHGETASKDFSHARVLIAPDGRLAHIGDDGVIVVQDLDTRRTLWSKSGGRGRLRSLAWSPEGERVVTGWGSAFDAPEGDAPFGEVLVHDSRTGEVLMRKDFPQRVLFVECARDGRLAVASGTVPAWTTQDISSDLAILDGGTLEEILVIPVSKDRRQRLPTLSFAPDGRRLALANALQFIVWDSRSGEKLHEREAERGKPPHFVKFLPDGKRLLLGFEKEVVLLDTETLATVLTFGRHSRLIHEFAMNPAQDRLVTASADHTLKVWDFATGEELVTLPAPASVSSVVFSADGESIIAATRDQAIRRWQSRGD